MIKPKTMKTTIIAITVGLGLRLLIHAQAQQPVKQFTSLSHQKTAFPKSEY
jgi:hypothetical protein